MPRPPSEGQIQADRLQMDHAMAVAATDTSELLVPGGDVNSELKVKFFSSLILIPTLFPCAFCPKKVGEGCPLVTSTPPNSESELIVKGRLRLSAAYWVQIGANVIIQDIVREGYKLPLISRPESVHFPNNRSALHHAHFVGQEVSELLRTGRIRQLDSPPLVVNPLTVSFCAGKYRLILDLTYINSFIVHQKIKFDDWTLMEQFVSRGSFLFKFDIKQGYHHVDIFSEHQTYLGFSWNMEGENKYFVFTVLPFGLSSGSFIFTKIPRPLIKYWRSYGVTIGCFLDDGLGVGEEAAKVKREALFVRQSLNQAGFVITEDKSVWEPCQSLVWLGVEVDTKQGFFKIPDTRVASLFQTLQKIISALPYTTARTLAKLCGKLISTKSVLGNIIQLKTRRLYHVIASQKGWDSRISLINPPKAVEELFFWQTYFHALNTKGMSTGYKIPLRGFSDASSTGLAGYIVINKEVKLAYRNLFPSELHESSTWRELQAIRYSISAFGSMLKDEFLLWHTDNYAASVIVTSGSNKPALQFLSEEIFSLCFQLNVTLSVKWIPRSCLTSVDFLSKQLDYDDWQTTSSFFEHINGCFGPLTIDRFADEYNSKLPRFNSKFHCVGTEGVDTFTQWWGNENNYLVPPISLVPKVLQHMDYCKARGVLVVPFWCSAAFWPQLLAGPSSFKSFVKEVLVFDDPEYCVRQGSNLRCAICAQFFKSPILVLIPFHYR